MTNVPVPDTLTTVKEALAIVPELHIDDWSMAYTDGLRTSRLTGRMLRDLVNRCEQAESDLVIEHAKAVQYELEAQTMRPMLLEAEANLAALRERHAEAVKFGFGFCASNAAGRVSDLRRHHKYRIVAERITGGLFRYTLIGGAHE